MKFVEQKWLKDEGVRLVKKMWSLLLKGFNLSWSTPTSNVDQLVDRTGAINI